MSTPTPIRLQWTDDGDGGTCATVEFSGIAALHLCVRPGYDDESQRRRLKVDWFVHGWDGANPLAMALAESLEDGQRRAEMAARHIVREIGKSLRGAL